MQNHKFCIVPRAARTWTDRDAQSGASENVLGRQKHPFTDIIRPCHSTQMTKLIRLGLCAVVATVSAPLASKESVDAARLRWVSGFLDAHWEYPNFIPDPDTGLKVMDFQVTEAKWKKIYAAPVKEALRSRPEETICFRVYGQGYLASRQPTMMQNWPGSQFVFMKIKKMERRSEVECASRTPAVSHAYK